MENVDENKCIYKNDNWKKIRMSERYCVMYTEGERNVIKMEQLNKAGTMQSY